MDLYVSFMKPKGFANFQLQKKKLEQIQDKKIEKKTQNDHEAT